MVNATVRPVHFEDFGGAEFERLVFAFHLRAGWADVAWFGQTGSDLGRDIVGTCPMDNQRSQRTVIQCVNRSALILAKAVHDMTAAVNSPTGKPDAFKFVCRSAVSANMRDRITTAAAGLGVAQVTIWSGVEFEEELRLRAQFLLQRFVDGAAFPDTEDGLRKFVDDYPNLTDADILAQMAAVLDRPAFRTPFNIESNLPDFQQALEGSIRALNTGVWQTREGIEIRHIPSVHHLSQPSNRSGIAQVIREIDEVRRVFKGGLKAGSIRHCRCGDVDCPTFMVDADVAYQLDAARRQALRTFQSLYPGFDVHIR